jgi:hypothetical protein
MSESSGLPNRCERLLSESEEKSVVGIIELGFLLRNSGRRIGRGTSGFPTGALHGLIVHCFKIQRD